ncbi:MAG: ABC transporter permease [Bacteroidia bacterium]|nr:ABC transporter permease [Bacteroidia bacterium]
MVFKLAWRNLWRNRRRTFITAGSVVLAVVLAVFMRSLQEGVYEKMIENVVGFYTGYVQIHKKGYWEEKTLENSFEAFPLISKAANQDDRVSATVPRLESFLLVAHEKTSQVAQIVGISPEEENSLTHLAAKVVEGHYLAPGQRAVMVGEGLADKLNLQIGDSLVLFGQGYHGVMASALLPVCAKLKFGSQELSNQISYVNLDVAQNMFAAPDRLTAYALNLSSAGSEKSVTKQLRSELPDEYEVMDWREMMPELVQSIESDRVGGYFTTGILYLIIAFGIFGTALMMIKERQYEFGVLTALGMKRGLLSQVMSMEMILMGMLGVLVGLAISVPLVIYFHYNPIVITGAAAEGYAAFGIEPIIPTAINPSLIFKQGLIVLGMTLLISIYPVVKIFQINPVEAMRV